jgi:UPF0755 protein
MRRITYWVGVGILVIFTVLSWPANPFDLSRVRVKIPEGVSVRAVQGILKENHVLPRYTVFRYAVRFLGIQNKIKAGEYSFSSSDNLIRIIAGLTLGETVPVQEVSITFPEGMSIYKMGMVLKENGFANWEKFQGLVNEGITASLRARHWNIFKYIPSESLEGYLFPDTYRFFLSASAEAMAETMIKRFDEVVTPFWDRAKKDTKMTLHEILTLASIIEKEAKLPAERSKISSIFHNRLRIGMPLAADPTVKYALERPSRRVYFDQLSVKSPYNTYKRRGLPPGPICNPGLESIRAAIYPAKTGYLFFVAKKDGSHRFSKTWNEHQKAREKTGK